MVIVVVFLFVITAFVSLKWHQERKSRRRLEKILRSGEIHTQPEEATGLLTDDFISVLSHELRTPLTPIRRFSSGRST
jgi:signal transduction histidine kinase